MHIYIVTALRFGCINLHNYCVGVSTNKDRAIEIAEGEHDYRGGKYGILVNRTIDSKWERIKPNDYIKYIPSIMQESEPYNDHFHFELNNMFSEFRFVDERIKKENPFDGASVFVVYRRFKQAIENVRHFEERQRRVNGDD